jgi:hypothetical protein
MVREERGLFGDGGDGAFEDSFLEVWGAVTALLWWGVCGRAGEMAAWACEKRKKENVQLIFLRGGCMDWMGWMDG